MDSQPEWVGQIIDRLDNMEAAIANLASKSASREWYSTDEVAKILSKAKFTVREWCRHGRVHCQKKINGRGKYPSWVISHEELLRIQREGLLPMERISTSIKY